MHWPNDLKLFLLPGLDGTGLLFDSFLKELPKECITEVISYPSNEAQTFEELVNYVKEKLPTTEPFVLLAESFSGPVAIEILRSGNFKIKRTFFVATFAKSPRPTVLSLAKHLPLTWLLKINIPELFISYYCLGNKASKEQIETFKTTIKKVKPMVLAQRLLILANVDKSTNLKDINTPCCYIQASADKLVLVDSLEVFRKGIAGIKTRTIQGPHFILQAEPRLCAEAICEEMAT